MASTHTAHSTLYLTVTLNSPQNEAANTSSIHVKLYSVADSGWGSGTYGSASWAVAGRSGTTSFSGTSVTWAEFDMTVTHDASGNYSATFTGSIGNTGTTTYGAGASVSLEVTLPRIPKAPGPPKNFAVTVSGHAATVTFGYPADDGGSTVINYVVQYSLNGAAFTGNVTNENGTVTFTGLTPGVYVFRAWAHNAIGNSQYATAAAVTILSGGTVIVGGAHKPAIVQVREDGAWHYGIVNIREDGAWKEAQ